MNHHKLIFLDLAIIIVAVGLSFGKQYTVNDYPNPQRYETHLACGLDQLGYLCDPDKVLSPNERVEFSRLLSSFKNLTQNPSGTTECSKKGISLAIAFSSEPIYYNYGSTSKAVPEALLKQWLIDENCHKAMLIVFISSKINQTDEFHFKQVPLVTEEVEHVLHSHLATLQQGKYIIAFSDILNQIRNLILKQQQTLSGSIHAPMYSIPSAPETTVSTVSTPGPTKFSDNMQFVPFNNSLSSSSTTLRPITAPSVPPNSYCQLNNRSLFMIQFLANVVAWLVVVTILIGVYAFWKKLRMRQMLDIIRNWKSTSKDCEAPVYMTQVSDCDDI